MRHPIQLKLNLVHGFFSLPGKKFSLRRGKGEGKTIKQIPKGTVSTFPWIRLTYQLENLSLDEALPGVKVKMQVLNMLILLLHRVAEHRYKICFILESKRGQGEKIKFLFCQMAYTGTTEGFRKTKVRK